MRRLLLALPLLFAGCGGGGDDGAPVSGGVAGSGQHTPFMTRPDPAQSLASCEQPAGTIGAPDLVADPLPDRGNGLAAGATTNVPASLPARVALRNERQTFNRRYEFALLGPRLRAGGLAAMPCDIREVYVDAHQLKLKWEGLYTVTNWFALREMRSFGAARSLDG